MSTAAAAKPAATSKPAAAAPAKKGPNTPLWRLIPEVWPLIRPAPIVIAGGFLLMVINRVAGLVLPFLTKYFVDDVLTKHQMNLLLPIVGTVFIATAIQGVTSYSLTQLVSKAAQRMIADMRRMVQAHVGRLPIAYYDTNKTGQPRLPHHE